MQLVRYLLVQLLAYGVDMGVFFLLFAHFHIEPLLANAVGKILAGIFAFIAHRRFTFVVAETGSKVQQGLHYFVLLALNIPLSALVLRGMLWVVAMTVVAKFLADMIYFVLSYWLSKHFVFIGSHPIKRNVDIGRGEQ